MFCGKDRESAEAEGRVMTQAAGFRGQTNHRAGLAAEAQVADHFLRAGMPIRERRWRGPGGEIDLICGTPEGLVFVEVKKGRDHAGAMARLTPQQLDRIRASAEAYAAGLPHGSLTEMRIDVALVDAHGRIVVVENATMH
jgi:putative endonuclease